MSSSVLLSGTLQPDGVLVFDERPDFPPGRVQVIVQPLPDLPERDPFWEMMQSIWAGQRARGHVPRTAEEVEAERTLLRAEWEERERAIESVQAESRRLREQLP